MAGAMTCPPSMGEGSYSQKMAVDFLTSVAAASAPPSSANTQIITESVERMRKTYCEVFEEQVQKEDKEWWKKQFTEFAEIAIKAMKEQEGQAGSGPVNIAYDGKTHLCTKELTLIGRYVGCDIPLKQNITSRLHAMVFILPNINKIIVVDVGSFFGIVTKERSSSEKSVHSLPNMRNVLFFDLNETVILSLGMEDICINPKECVVCMEEARNCRFGCNHWVTCTNCASKLQDCPICRKPIDGRQVMYATATSPPQGTGTHLWGVPLPPLLLGIDCSK